MRKAGPWLELPVSYLQTLKFEPPKDETGAAFLLYTDLIINETSGTRLINALHNTIIEHLSCKCPWQSITQPNWENGLDVSLSLPKNCKQGMETLYKECSCSLPTYSFRGILLAVLKWFPPWSVLIEYVHRYLELSTNPCESGIKDV